MVRVRLGGAGVEAGVVTGVVVKRVVGDGVVVLVLAGIGKEVVGDEAELGEVDIEVV